MKKSTQFPGMCTFCSGTGVGAMGRTCFVCHGSGMTGPMKKSATVSVKCPLCEGAGTTVLGKTCPGCHGAGYTGPMKSAPLVQHDANCPHCTTPSGTAVNPAGAVFVDSYLKKVLKSRMVLRGDQDAAELLKQMK
jgi:cytochrome c5